MRGFLLLLACVLASGCVLPWDREGNPCVPVSVASDEASYAPGEEVVAVATLRACGGEALVVPAGFACSEEGWLELTIVLADGSRYRLYNGTATPMGEYLCDGRTLGPLTVEAGGEREVRRSWNQTLFSVEDRRFLPAPRGPVALEFEAPGDLRATSRFVLE